MILATFSLSFMSLLMLRITFMDAYLYLKKEFDEAPFKTDTDVFPDHVQY